MSEKTAEQLLAAKVHGDEARSAHRSALALIDRAVELVETLPGPTPADPHGITELHKARAAVLSMPFEGRDAA